MRAISLSLFLFIVAVVNTTLAQQPLPPQVAPKDAAAHNAASNAAADAALRRQAESVTARGSSLINTAFQRTKTAQSFDDFTNVITLCQQGLSQGVNPEEVAYADRLMAWAHNRRGELHADAKRNAEALSDFSTAVAMDAKNWRALHNRGVCMATMGSLDDALGDFNRVLEINKDYANTWFNRGELKYQRGDFNAAIADYTEAIRLAPRDAAAYSSRGHALYRLGHIQQAGTDFNASVELAPQNATALIHRGDFFVGQGNYAQAAQDYRQSIRVNPRLGRAYQSAAWLMATCADERFRNPQMAIETAQQAVNLDGKNYRYLDTLAAAWASAGKFEEAIMVQKQAVQAIAEADSGPYEERLKMYIDRKPYRAPAQVATAPAPIKR